MSNQSPQQPIAMTRTREFLLYLTDPARLMGPIFDKELRVSSRRVRNYLLRFGYLAALGLAVVIVWLSNTLYARVVGSPALQTALMPEAGKNLIATIVWIQFVMSQVLGVIMLSNAISKEIYDRTLSVLMTTPTNSFHIVTGKLFGRLLQIIILLAISLPILAITRVMGGVPAGYLLSSFCITMTGLIFAGSLSLFFSIHHRHAYTSIIMTLAVYFMLFVLLPLADNLTTLEVAWYPGYARQLMLINPFIILFNNTVTMLTPATSGASTISWPVHCGLLLAASLGLLLLSMRSVRKAALLGIAGQLPSDWRQRRRERKKSDLSNDLPEQKTNSQIRRITGSPIMWKESKLPLIKGNKATTGFGLILFLVVLVFSYGYCYWDDLLDKDITQMAFPLIYLSIGLIVTIVISAACVSSEKEARTYPVLMTSILNDKEIILGKIIGVLRRTLPVWILLFSHLLISSLAGWLHPIAIIHLALITAGSVFLLAAAGVFFSVCFKRTLTAVAFNLGATLLFWLILPMSGLGLCCLGGFVAFSNPIALAVLSLSGTAGALNARKSLAELDYMMFEPLSFLWITLIQIVIFVIFVGLGALFISLSKDRLRRNIF
ncbi:MAG: ABC transporter permease subunit [Planctomycetes bacterium]|nr:ABC transporter permease subunit [Planctomycetota bacterium]